MGEPNYGAALIRNLGSLDNGGQIKLATETSQTRWKPLSADKLKRIAAIVAEPEPEGANDPQGVGPEMAMKLLLQWIKSEPDLLARARRVAEQDKKDRSAVIFYWINCLLGIGTTGPFDRSREPKADAAKVTYLRERISPADLHKIDWNLFGELILLES